MVMLSQLKSWLYSPVSRLLDIRLIRILLNVKTNIYVMVVSLIIDTFFKTYPNTGFSSVLSSITTYTEIFSMFVLSIYLTVYVYRAKKVYLYWELPLGFLIFYIVAYNLNDNPPFFYFLSGTFAIFSFILFLSLLYLLVIGIYKWVLSYLPGTHKNRMGLEKSVDKIDHPRQNVSRSTMPSFKSVAVGSLFFILILLSASLYTELQQVKKKVATIERHLGGEDVLSCNEGEMIERVKKSVVRVVGGYSEGSGVIIQDNGTIVTNHHVIQFEPSPKIIFPDYSFKTADVIYADKGSDIALLKIRDGGSYQALPLDTGRINGLKQLQTVYAFGFPLGMDIKGQATVQRGAFVSTRNYQGFGYIQTDISLNPGQSGGALTDACGHLIGINAAGLAGLGMAVSSKTTSDTWIKLIGAKEPKKDVQMIEFKPNESALEAVRAFYNYQKVRKLEEAYKLISPDYLKGTSYDQWKQGYELVLDVSLLDSMVKPVKGNKDPNKVLIGVKLISRDLAGDAVVDKYFEGEWWVRKEDGNWRLYDPDMSEVKDPENYWFYSRIDN